MLIRDAPAESACTIDRRPKIPDGVMLLWFILTAISVLYVAIDIANPPEAAVIKWGFVILTLFSGPLGVFF